MSANPAKTSAELARVIEDATESIEEAFASVLYSVHEHGRLEERERVVKWLRAHRILLARLPHRHDLELVDRIAEFVASGTDEAP